MSVQLPTYFQFILFAQRCQGIYRFGRGAFSFQLPVLGSDGFTHFFEENERDWQLTAQREVSPYFLERTEATRNEK